MRRGTFELRNPRWAVRPDRNNWLERERVSTSTIARRPIVRFTDGIPFRILATP